MTRSAVLLAPCTWLFCLCTDGWAQVATAASGASAPTAPVAITEKPYSLDFKPVLLDTGSSAGTSLGLDYDFTGKYEFWSSSTGGGRPTISLDELDKTFHKGQLDLRARGTLAASAEKNPNKLLDFGAALVLKLNAQNHFARLGGTLAFETDQGFDHKQTMFGLTTTVSKVRWFIPGDAGSLIANFGTVDPSKNKERQALLGNLNSFRRWDVEVSYSIPIRNPKVRSVDFDYRHYQEVSAPSQIRSAGLDRNRLGLVRVNLDQDFFLQYSRGSLPFDQKSERTIKLGWSMKFE